MVPFITRNGFELRAEVDLGGSEIAQRLMRATVVVEIEVTAKALKSIPGCDVFVYVNLLIFD